MADDDPWEGPVDGEADDETAFWRGVRQEANARHFMGDAPRREWFEAERAKANLVPCRDCKRPVDVTCIEVDSDPPRPLLKFPAHTRRVVDAAARAAGRLPA